MARQTQPAPGMIEASALVVQAEAPPQGFWSMNVTLRGSFMRAIVDVGTGPRMVTVEFSPSEDKWLVRGQDIPVWVDPRYPEGMLVNWAAIPSMRDRVAAADPALVDPISAARRATAGMGQAPPDGDWDKTPAAQRRTALVDFLRQQPPRPGYVWAQVFVVSKRPKNRSDNSDPNGGNYLSTEVTSETVLSVQPLDRPPYALFVEKFKVPKGRRDLVSAGYPALVSESDPTDVTVRWDDVPTGFAQMNVRLAEAVQRSGTQQAQAIQQLRAMAMQQRAAAAQQWTAAQQAVAAQQWAAQQAAAQQWAAQQAGGQQPGGPQWAAAQQAAAAQQWAAQQWAAQQWAAQQAAQGQVPPPNAVPGMPGYPPAQPQYPPGVEPPPVPGAPVYPPPESPGSQQQPEPPDVV